MAQFVFNIALGKVGYYAELPEASDALILIPIETSGIEADDAMRDHDDLAALLAGSSSEQSTMGRKTLSGVTWTIDDTANDAQLDFTATTYTAASGNAVSSWLICYDGDTGAGTDANIIPLLKFDKTLTPDGNDVEVSAPSGAFTA